LKRYVWGIVTACEKCAYPFDLPHLPLAWVKPSIQWDETRGALKATCPRCGYARWVEPPTKRDPYEPDPTVQAPAFVEIERGVGFRSGREALAWTLGPVVVVFLVSWILWLFMN